MGFSKDIKNKAMVAGARHCCICHRFCGLKIECHHIQPESEGGLDTFDNCIPLCFDCHADMRSYDHKHPRGTKYSATELLRHRDGWYESVRVSGATSAATVHRAADLQVFRRFQEDIPWDETMRYLSWTPCGGGYRRATLDPLYKYAENINDPLRRFLDEQLETARAAFVESLHGWLQEVGTYMWISEVSEEIIQVPHDWHYEQRAEAHEAIDNSVEALLDSYNEVIRTAQRRLDV